ncbi:phospholipase D-like domain-containing protein, partial [Virgibacillus salexigens]|uniref:phospholipase D-like domain-containing protein n=1 Tax=Virgibacillus salexigens TaxID=61016 RepID=UPI001F26E9A1
GVQIVTSGPDSGWEQIKNGYIKMIMSAKDYIYIQTPYFIPDESLRDVLRIAALSGVDVKIMIPNKPDHPFVYWATLSYIGDLLDAGAEGYIYQNGFLHA